MLNTELCKEKIRAKYNNQREFASALGIGVTQLSEYVTGKRMPEKPLFKLMAMLLEVSEDDLKEAPKMPVNTIQSAVPSATSLIQIDELKGQITSLQDEMRALRNDLSMTAKMLIEINKTAHETKAQAGLNAEELTAIFNKVGEINGNVTKLYATKKKGY